MSVVTYSAISSKPILAGGYEAKSNATRGNISVGVLDRAVRASVACDALT